MIRTRQHCLIHFCPNFKQPGHTVCRDHIEHAPPPELPYAHVAGPLFAAGIVNGEGSWQLALDRIKALSAEEALQLWEALAAGAEALSAVIETGAEA